MKITNISKGIRGVNTTEGTQYLEPGQSADVELAKGEAATLSKEWFKTGAGAAKAEKEEEPAPGGDTGAAYEVRKGGAGTFSIVDGEGVEVIAKITKKEADEFSGLDDEAKAAWVIEKSAS
jgi:hypothetical protein